MMGTVAPREALSQPALRTVTAMAWQFIITWQRSVSKQIEMSSEPTVVPVVQGVVRGCGARVWRVARVWPGVVQGVARDRRAAWRLARRAAWRLAQGCAAGCARVCVAGWRTFDHLGQTRKDKANNPRANEPDDQLLVDHERHRLAAEDRRDRAAAVRVHREQHEPVHEADLWLGVEDGGAVARAVADEADPEDPGELALEERGAFDRADHLRRGHAAQRRHEICGVFNCRPTLSMSKYLMWGKTTGQRQQGTKERDCVCPAYTYPDAALGEWSDCAASSWSTRPWAQTAWMEGAQTLQTDRDRQPRTRIL